MPRLDEGLIQVYTGNGKGKTTAALGQALRAAGRGLKVYIIQFIKGGFDYGELYIVDKIPNIELKAFGRGRFITGKKPKPEDLEEARRAMELAKKVISSGEYDIVILDEINVALYYGLIKVDDVVEMLKKKPKHVEVILTGRKAPDEIVELADLVTEMVEVKHPYQKGMPPRLGIEY